jgi:DNA-3-methyladenine glycosylase I
MKRCEWCNPNNSIMKAYHDHEWGEPVFDDHKLFEMLILEGAQAGLSWETILKKREAYQLAYDNFDPNIVANYDDSKQRTLIENNGIVRNKLKVKASIKNAQIFCDIQKEYGSFSNFLWSFVNHKPVLNEFDSIRDVPVSTTLSDEISNILKQKGMKFVGTTIIYAYVQAVGVVNDHTRECFKFKSADTNNE